MKPLFKIIKAIGIILILIVISLAAILIFNPNKPDKKYRNGSHKYSKADLNIRKGPGIKHEVLKTIHPNDKIITYDSVVNGFIMILNSDSSKYGWASNNYLQSMPLSREQLDAIKFQNDPLRIGKENIRELIGESVPYDKWDRWGNPVTLDGTNNSFWVAYLPKSNISFVSNKETDIIIFAGFGKDRAKNYLKRMLQNRKKKIESQFSAWDGSHKKLEMFIKRSMHDPDSYEHVETVYSDRQSHLIVKTTFRGKNAFGATVKNWVKAKVDAETGEILNVIDKGPN